MGGYRNSERRLINATVLDVWRYSKDESTFLNENNLFTVKDLINLGGQVQLFKYSPFSLYIMNNNTANMCDSEVSGTKQDMKSVRMCL